MTIDEAQPRAVRRQANARVFSSSFTSVKSNTQDDLEKHGDRIATALDIDRVRKIFEFGRSSPVPPCMPGAEYRRLGYVPRKTTWNGSEWMNEDNFFRTMNQARRRLVPAQPFRILNAPNLKDDFYCSPLAYSATSKTLAVCLGNLVYAWSEDVGVQIMHGAPSETWLTSISFSSTEGGKSILGIGQSDGCLVLRSIYDGLPRFEVQQDYPIACVSWRPSCTLRPSRNPFNPGVPVQTEDFVVGDEMGTLYYYMVEWPMGWEVSRDTWPGAITLLSKISVHSQQICGLAWAPDGKLFASGSNDNLCCLFEVDQILYQDQTHINPRRNRTRGVPLASETNAEQRHRVWFSAIDSTSSILNPLVPSHRPEIGTFRTSLDTLHRLGAGVARHRWIHGAAVKAIAFCPWRRGLVATGGGSNDKCIHFFHTSSGRALATISVLAQVTSLIWSTTRREIAATFGYANPEHPYRIAIFSWPDCKQVAAVPWQGELRALYAISYPRGPLYNKTQKRESMSQEGCIVVASSDKSVKFYEVWSGEKRACARGSKILMGSANLEDPDGFEREDVIR
ncbi:WD40-repeat-containing domain protein [Mariannaea sp. PMI_226]|nr:WD40-repeat-containing domain protein [Mariannaea sp. PMI_226]